MVTARGSGRIVEPRPEDALPDMRPFSDPMSYEPWCRYPVTMPVKVALEAHGALIKHYGHSGVRQCPCPLAKAACTAWDGGA